MTTYHSSLAGIFRHLLPAKVAGKLALLCFVFLAAFLQPVRLQAQDPGKGGTQAGFQVDADFHSGSIPSFWIGSGASQNYFPNTTVVGSDWSGPSAVLLQLLGVSVPGRSADGRSVWQVDGNWGTASTTPELVSFSGSSNKNGDNISAGQKPYSLQLGGSGPQKNDITNTYLHSRQQTVGGVAHTWLFFGAETRATNGNSYIDFEYNQAGVTTTATQLIGNGPVNGRSVGDFLLVVNYTGGGNRPVIGARKWLATGTWSDELPVTATQFMTTNAAGISPVAPNRAFGSDGAAANTVLPLQFVEGGIDITDLNIAELNLCTAAATVTVKTRSSSSYTAELKDLDVLNFSLLPPAALTNLVPQTVCPTSAATFTTTVSGDGALGSNVQWFYGTGTTPLVNGTKYTINSTTTTSTLVVNNVAAADGGSYKAKLVNATCGTPEKSTTLIVNPVPMANAGADPDPQCYKAAGNVFEPNGSSSANGTAGWTRLSPAILPTGVTVSFDNAASFTPKVTVSGAAAGIIVTLRLTVTSNASPACGSVHDDVTIEVKAQAAGTDGAIQPITCTDAGFKLKINTPVAGTIYTVTQPCNSAYNSSLTAGTGDVVFEGLKFAAGYKIVASLNGCEAAPVECGGTTCTNICPSTTAAPAPATVQSLETITARIESKRPVVSAAPNPFSTRLQFRLQSDVSGRGTLELYNSLGQKVQVVYQGFVEAGKWQTIDYNVPVAQRTNLIYIFRVGNQEVSGKLVGLKQ